MPPGKLGSQSGHAFLNCFLLADADRQRDYHSDGIGTKICLTVPDLPALLVARDCALAAGLPCFLVEDTGNNTTFGGVATISALGIGPVVKDEVPFLHRLKLHP